jgi:hydrogenase expression/formation protein HypC
MCLAVPGKVVAIDGSIAKVDFGGVQRETNVSLVDVKVGEYVIVHAGFAIQIIDEDEAKETLKLWEELLATQDHGENPEPI